MIRLVFIISILFIYSCDKQFSTSIDEPKNKIVKNMGIYKKDNFKAITFKHDIKIKYQNHKSLKNYKKEELNFNRVFRKIRKKVLTIQIYVNFENFSSIPDIYKNNIKDDNIFYILGINIGDNYILTELNILKEASVIYIKTDEGISYLDLVGYDENYNIAVLKSSKQIKKEKIDVLSLKNINYSPGELIFSLFAISNNKFSFRKHFINFLHYSKFYEIIDSIYSESLSYIENSGGIVFNSSGEFLGLISLYDPYYQNSAFITSSEIIKKLLPKLREGLYIKNNAWLGLYIREHDNSVFVKKVVNKSPAQLAGIKAGDKIIKINNKKIKSKKDIKKIMNFINSNNIIGLILIRNGQKLNISLKLIDKPLKYLYKNKDKCFTKKIKKIGIKLTKENNQIVISEVEEGSLAFIYGVKVGDKILEISGKKIKSIKEYNNYVNNLHKNKSIRIKILRGQEVKLIAFRKS